ncbi:hypothetical protein [Flavobacterium sp. N2038]|uniref:hypothetical protein n=1 Tax=Flavobacterium sp. N2038 TaxID=2986829 RepID=UPI002224AA1E|nr:hypothetical protein [Flavobacterium sp. N2038]
MQNEYYNTTQISNLTELDPRQILYIIKQINTTNDLLFKNKRGEYQIHRLLLPRFKKSENKRIKHFAYSTDLPKGYTEKQLVDLMKYVLSLCKDYTRIELSIEQKNKNGELHIHSILSTKNKTDYIRNMALVFGSHSYKCSKLFDRQNWVSYCTKYGTELITITNKKTN